MKCEVTSHTTHDVLISKEVSWKSYKEICLGEPKEVNLGFWGNWFHMKVENNSLQASDRNTASYIYGDGSNMVYDSEVLLAFFSIHNIEPNWLDCNYTYGYYDEDLGGWTGYVGKV